MSPNASSSHQKSEGSRLGAVLQAAMISTDMTQADLAKRSGVSGGSISRLLAGKIAASPETLRGLVKAFQSADVRAHLVKSFIQDALPYDLASMVTIQPRQSSELKLDALSLRGRAALAYLLELQAEGHQLENVIIDLAIATGFDGV